jgi:hypothetical protein
MEGILPFIAEFITRSRHNRSQGSASEKHLKLTHLTIMVLHANYQKTDPRYRRHDKQFTFDTGNGPWKEKAWGSYMYMLHLTGLKHMARAIAFGPRKRGSICCRLHRTLRWPQDPSSSRPKDVPAIE